MLLESSAPLAARVTQFAGGADIANASRPDRGGEGEGERIVDFVVREGLRGAHSRDVVQRGHCVGRERVVVVSGALERTLKHHCAHAPTDCFGDYGDGRCQGGARAVLRFSAARADFALLHASVVHDDGVAGKETGGGGG